MGEGVGQSLQISPRICSCTQGTHFFTLSAMEIYIIWDYYYHLKAVVGLFLSTSTACFLDNSTETLKTGQ